MAIGGEVATLLTVLTFGAGGIEVVFDLLVDVIDGFDTGVVIEVVFDPVGGGVIAGNSWEGIREVSLAQGYDFGQIVP